MKITNIIILFFLISCKGNNSTIAPSIPKVLDSAIAYDPNQKLPVRTKDQNNTLYKVGDFLFTGKKGLVFDFFRNNNPPKEIKSKGDTLFHDNEYTILTDFNQVTSWVYKKINLKHNFEMFKVNEIYKGKFSQPNFKTDQRSLHYKTMIKYSCEKDTISFAGHYTIAEWGCGMECSMMAVIDRIDGRIYYSRKYLPFDNIDGHWGVEYKKDSRMIIVNSHLLEDYPGYCMQDWRKMEVYEWKDNKFIKLE